MTEEVKDEDVQKAAQESLEQVEEIVEEQQQEVDPIEAQAREKGWRPKEEFEGDPDTWVDAKEFTQREPLYKALHQANRKIKKMQDTLDTFRDHYTKVEVAAKEKAIKELQEQLDVASEERDIGKALQIKDKLTEVQKEKEKASEPVKNTAFESWVEENTWYNNKPVLRTFATGIGFGLQQEHPDWSVEQIYNEVTRITKESFPDEFGTTKKPNKVASTNRTTGGKPNKKTYSVKDLPEEARINYNRLVKSDRNPTGVLTSEEFFKDYLAVNGTIIAE